MSVCQQIFAPCICHIVGKVFWLTSNITSNTGATAQVNHAHAAINIQPFVYGHVVLPLTGTNRMH
jgi:hypothetical protein